MKKYLIAAVLVAVGGSAQAGPFGLFGRNRCKPVQTTAAPTPCSSCQPSAFQPVRTAVVLPFQVAGEVIQAGAGVLHGTGVAIQQFGGVCRTGQCGQAVTK